MPCWTEKQTSIEFKAENMMILKEALQAMGFTVYYDGLKDYLSFSGSNNETGAYENGVYQNGNLTCSESLDVKSISRSYASIVVQAKFKKYGWKLTKTKTGFQAQKN